MSFALTGKNKKAVCKESKIKVKDIGDEVSEYAKKSNAEWFAECFAEYMDSPNPRKMAKTFGKMLEEAMREATRK